MTALPPHLAAMQRLFDQLAAPDITCPRCRGKGETYSAYREHVCSLCDGIGQVPSDGKAQRERAA